MNVWIEPSLFGRLSAAKLSIVWNSYYHNYELSVVGGGKRRNDTHKNQSKIRTTPITEFKPHGSPGSFELCRTTPFVSESPVCGHSVPAGDSVIVRNPDPVTSLCVKSKRAKRKQRKKNSKRAWVPKTLTPTKTSDSGEKKVSKDTSPLSEGASNSQWVIPKKVLRSHRVDAVELEKKIEVCENKFQSLLEIGENYAGDCLRGKQILLERIQKLEARANHNRDVCNEKFAEYDEIFVNVDLRCTLIERKIEGFVKTFKSLKP